LFVNFFLQVTTSFNHFLPSTPHIPVLIESRTKDHATHSKCRSNEEIDHIMISQVDCRENESTDDREKEIKEELFITMSQE